jgi:predicted nucleotidyltransferase
MDEPKPRILTQTQKTVVIRQLKAQLPLREEISFAYIYGSFVEGKYFRDVDVALYVDEQLVAEAA